MKYYKYVKPDGIDILINNRIMISDFCVTNDPLEILPRIDYPTDEGFWDTEFARHVANDPLFEPSRRAKRDNPAEYESQRTSFIRRAISMREYGMREMPRRLRDGFAQVTGFVCLTTKPDDIVMWGHYTDCHKGMVVEFDGDNELFVNVFDKKGNKLRVFPVDYRDTRPVLKYGDPFRPELLACKSKVWQYEQEIRILFNKNFCHNDGKHIYFPIPPCCITGVILGARTSSNFTDSIHSLNKSNWNGALNILRAIEDTEDYRMLIQKDIDD